MSKKVTEYEDRRRATADVAVRKAKVHGQSDWPFTYRGQTVVVEAKKKGNKIVTRTTPVKNKG